MKFCIQSGGAIRLCYDSKEPEAVKIAIANLEQDFGRVFSNRKVVRAERVPDRSAAEESVIVIRTLAVDGNSRNMAAGGSEAFLERVMQDEMENFRKEAYQLRVENGILYITGSDRRGTIYGIYTFCEKLGVSPWHFFADVPVKHKEEFTLEDGYCVTDWPSVEYRGIFINDEEELEDWVQNYMGEPTIGVKSYEKIFELLLRLKANYIWPAMHVNSFNQTPENGALAERMGIVVGTSHCDMLMRSNNREWKPWIQKKGYKDAVYDYSVEGKNRDILKEYWRESVEQNRNYEVCYTLGMRGIHDSGFETRGLEGKSDEEVRAAKVALLEQIIADQREILKETFRKRPEAAPEEKPEESLAGDEALPMMTFIPYKEVLELYDNGLKIPEDMTLVWANDNYGYIRRYPSEEEKARKGGNGIYYHNSYWAPPSMSYVFLCSIPLAHTRNELQKAWNEGIRKLWVLNSGAIKPLEQEITFFLRLAWEIGKPGALTEDVEAFVEDWANRSFSGNGRCLREDGEPVESDGTVCGDEESMEAGGTVWKDEESMETDGSFRENGKAAENDEDFGKSVSRLLNDFSQLTNVRKIENMDYDAFSQTAYGDEAVIRIHRYEELFRRGNALYTELPEEERDAFFQLVLMRIHAAYFTNLAYYYGDRSTLMYDRGNMQAAAFYTERSRETEDSRRRMLHYYNHVMHEGKWNGILNPEGFPPPRTAMMPVCTPPLKVEGVPRMRVDIWNEEREICFSAPGEKWIEIGNQGTGEFGVRLQAPPWAELSEERTVVQWEKRILIRVRDVSENRTGEILAENMHDGSIWRIPVRIMVPNHGQEKEEGAESCRTADKFQMPQNVECAVEEDGLIGIEAGRADAGNDFHLIPRLGRMQGDVMEVCVQREPGGMDGAEKLRYSFHAFSKGEFLLEIHRFPSLNSVGRLRIGVSLDNGPMRIVESESNDEWRGSWKENVLNNVDRLCLSLHVRQPGRHTLCLWAIDRYFAFSRLVIYTKPRKENNLAGIRGPQALPEEWDMAGWCRGFYAGADLPPRPVYYAGHENSGDCLAVDCQETVPKGYGERVLPDWYLEQGRHIFGEKDGAIRIDAASVLAQSGCAWTEQGGKREIVWTEQGGRREIAWTGQEERNGAEQPSQPDKAEPGQRATTLWRHCSSESYGRSGLAMYIRTPKLRWQGQAAPSLNYRICCKGDLYTVWMLSKFNVLEEGFFSMGIDGKMLPEERLYGNGSLWRYEAEQVYRWIPACQLELEAGEHVLHVYALASGMRYDRFYLAGGEEQPPMDMEWQR